MNDNKMQAAALYGKQDLRVAEADMPQIDAGEILLRVKGAFVCGTDVRMYHNGYPGISETTPMILGHEGSGVVVRCGSDVKNFKEGMRVAVAPNVGCGICDYCVSGNTHLCSHSKALGIHMPGFFAEYVKIPEDFVRQGNVVEIPDSLSFEEAALAEPLSCVFNAFEKSKIRPGETVLVIGAGPIGLMHAKMAQIAGVEKIIINDLSRERLDLCRQIDSTFITLESENLKEELDTLTEGRGVDVCITACPAPQAQQIALELAAINGRIVFFGGLPADKAHVQSQHQPDSLQTIGGHRYDPSKPESIPAHPEISSLRTDKHQRFDFFSDRTGRDSKCPGRHIPGSQLKKCHIISSRNTQHQNKGHMSHLNRWP